MRANKRSEMDVCDALLYSDAGGIHMVFKSYDATKTGIVQKAVAAAVKELSSSRRDTGGVFIRRQQRQSFRQSKLSPAWHHQLFPNLHHCGYLFCA